MLKHSINALFLVAAVSCGGSGQYDISDPINYEVLQGEWKIREIHVYDTESDSLESFISNVAFAPLSFYRPTLGDPARVEMSWICEGLGFSYEYSSNTMHRLDDVSSESVNITFSGPKDKVQVVDAQSRRSCVGPAPSQEQESAKISALMPKLAKRLTIFENYQIEYYVETETISLFTSEGDGIYASRN